MWPWILFLGYFGLFIWIINRVSFFRFSTLPKWISAALFCLKVGAGFALYYIYTFYYTDHEHSDTWKYFNDAKSIYSWCFDQPKIGWRFLWGIDLNTPELQPFIDQLHGWTNPYTYGLSHDGPTIVRINLIMMFFSGGFYPIHILFMCFLSLAGLRALHRVFESRMAATPWITVGLLFLAPSLLFWSSGVLKEAPLIGALGFLWWSFDELLHGKKTILVFVKLLLAIYLMYWLKEYVLLCCLPALFFLLVLKIGKGIKPLYVFLLTQSIVILFALHPGPFYSAGNLVYVLQKKQTDFYNVSNEMAAGSVIELPTVKSDIDLLIHFPQAFAVTFFRPFIGEANGAVAQLSAVENSFYGLIFLLALWSIGKRVKVSDMWWASLSVILFSALIIGNSVPVLGAVVRYKIAALPFFLFWCWSVIIPLWKKSAHH